MHVVKVHHGPRAAIVIDQAHAVAVGCQKHHLAIVGGRVPGFLGGVFRVLLGFHQGEHGLVGWVVLHAHHKVWIEVIVVFCPHHTNGVGLVSQS